MICSGQNCKLHMKEVFLHSCHMRLENGVSVTMLDSRMSDFHSQNSLKKYHPTVAITGERTTVRATRCAVDRSIRVHSGARFNAEKLHLSAGGAITHALAVTGGGTVAALSDSVISCAFPPSQAAKLTGVCVQNNASVNLKQCTLKDLGVCVHAANVSAGIVLAKCVLNSISNKVMTSISASIKGYGNVTTMTADGSGSHCPPYGLIPEESEAETAPGASADVLNMHASGNVFNPTNAYAYSFLIHICIVIYVLDLVCESYIFLRRTQYAKVNVVAVKSAKNAGSC